MNYQILSKFAAVVTAEGVGDGLIMMILSEQLKRVGFDVTSYVGRMSGLDEWFPGHKLISGTPISDFEKYQLIFLQHHNQPLAKELWQKRRDGKLPQLVVIYQSHRSPLYPPLQGDDISYDQNLTMVDNTAKAIARFLSIEINRSNGITPLPALIYRKYLTRVVIHPASTYPPKNWHPKQFLQLSNKLKERGFDPIFTVSPEEKNAWETLLNQELPHFETLGDLASFIYESGYHIGNDSGNGHLASSLGIPSLTVTKSPKHMKLWQPGWGNNIVITPSKAIPNLKLFRLREKYWQKFITARRVFKSLLRLTSSSSHCESAFQRVESR